MYLQNGVFNQKSEIVICRFTIFFNLFPSYSIIMIFDRTSLGFRFGLELASRQGVLVLLVFLRLWVNISFWN